MDDGLPRLDLTGHPALRATHAKTLEFAPDASVSDRATCIIGVAARVTGGACAGPVRITIDAGGVIATVDAVANPDWAGGTAIVRRSTDRRPDTFATEATAGAADLPRELAARIIDPAVAITVRCARLPRRPTGGPGWCSRGRRRARHRHRGWPPSSPPPTPSSPRTPERSRCSPGSGPPAPPTPRPGSSPASSGGCWSSPPRACPGASMTAASRLPDRIAVEVAGLPAAVAATAASPVRGPVQLAGPVGRSRIDAVLRSVSTETTLAVSVAAGDVARLLERAVIQRGTATAAVLDPAAGGLVRWGPVGELRVTRTSGEIVCVLDGTSAESDLGAELTAFVRGLLAEGVSTRSAALALAGLPGWSRRRAYDAVLAVEPDA